MNVTCCDICGQPLKGKDYRDENGKDWRDITFEEHKYSKTIFSFFKGRNVTEYISVCAYCRSKLSKRNPNKWGTVKGE